MRRVVPLVLGDSGTAVADLHRALATLDADGGISAEERSTQRFGPGTRNAVVSLQQRFSWLSLEPGHLDQHCADRLNVLLAEATEAAQAPAEEDDQTVAAIALDQRSLDLLRAFELVSGGNAICLPTRAQRLIALLAVTHRALSRSTIAARLWPDVVNAKANASLRATLWSLARHAPSLVMVDSNTLVLNPGIRLDLDEAYAVAESILDGTYSCENGRSEAKLHEDLLPAWTDEWLVIERERFRQTRLHALDELCVLHAREGRFARAIAAGLASVSSEPTRESAHRALMTAHLLEGNRMEAIRQYHTYLSIAKAEMGIGPSDRLQHLFLSALKDAPNDEAMTPR